MYKHSQLEDSNQTDNKCLLFSYAPRNTNPPRLIQHTRGTKPENKLMRENNELQIRYLMDNQRGGELGILPPRSYMIHIDYNDFRLSYTSK